MLRQSYAIQSPQGLAYLDPCQRCLRQLGLRNNAGSLAIFAAIRRAWSLLSSLAAMSALHPKADIGSHVASTYSASGSGAGARPGLVSSCWGTVRFAKACFAPGL